MFLRGYVTKYVTAQPFVSGARFSIGQSFCEPQPAVRSDRHQTAGYIRETRGLQHADLPQKADLVVEQIFLYDLPVLPSGDCAELERERLSVAGWTFPSSPCHGPIIFPVHLAMVQVQSPEANITLYGLLSRWFSMDLKNASDSA